MGLKKIEWCCTVAVRTVTNRGLALFHRIRTVVPTIWPNADMNTNVWKFAFSVLILLLFGWQERASGL